MIKLQSNVAGLAVASALALGSTVALADGGPGRSVKDAPAPFSWSGPYIGVNVGYAWGESKVNSATVCPSSVPFPLIFSCFYNLAPNLSAISNLGTGSRSPSSVTGGVQAGVNWQHSNIVYGVEVDFNALDFNSSRTGSVLLPLGVGQTSTVTTAMDAEWLFTARGRLGVTAAPNLLLFATGGLAMTSLTVSNSYTDNCAAFCGGTPNILGSSSRSELKTGWTAGAGFEWAMSRNWTFKGEYLYVDFGAVRTLSLLDITPNPGGFFTFNTLGTSADLSMHIGRAGINYKF